MAAAAPITEIFYVKLWRGPLYWLSFGLHGLSNLAVVLVSSFVIRLGF